MTFLLRNIMKTFQISTNRQIFASLHTSAIRLGLRNKDRMPILVEFKKRVEYMKEKGLWPENRRSDFAEWNYDAEIYAFGKRINEEFQEALIREALIDKLYVKQELEKVAALGMKDTFTLKSNVELAEAGRNFAKEFITKYLRTVWPLVPEEGIESVTNYLTSDETFSSIGEQMGMKDLIMSKEYPPSAETYATSFSAIIGALFQSSGFERSCKFIKDFIIAKLVGKILWDVWYLEDPMNTLMNILEASGRGAPEPRIIGDIGKNTIEATFYIGLYSDKQFIGAGYGSSSEEGIYLAALDSLSRIFNVTSDSDPLPIDSPISHTTQLPNVSLNKYVIKNSL